MKLGDARRQTQELSSTRAGSITQQQNVRKRKSPPYALHFIQGNGADGEALDMPDDGKDFDTDYLCDKTFRITKARIFSTAGTYTVQLKVDGSLVGQQMTNSTTYPYFFTTPIFYTDNWPITLHVDESADVEGFVACFTLIEV